MDDAKANLVEELSSLLRLLPGVSIDSSDIRPGNLSLVVAIERIESIGPIVYAACGANISLDLWTIAPPEPVPERANPAHVRYRIGAKDLSANPKATIEAFEFLGIYLVWYLHGIGVMPVTSANRLLSKWHGKKIST